MKKSTAGFALLFALLLSYVLLVEKKEFFRHGTALNNGGKVFQFKPDEITRISLKGNLSHLELTREGSKIWEITKPFHDWADPTLCDELTQMLSSLVIQRFISKKEPLKAYGLDQNSLSLEIELKSGTTEGLRIGREDPLRDGFYAFLPAKSQIALLPVSTAEYLFRSAESWRDHALLRFQEQDIQQIEVQRSNAKLVLSKTKNGWEIKSPFSEKADEGKIIQLLNLLSQSRSMGFANPDTTSLHPILTVTLKQNAQTPLKRLFLGEKTSQGYLSSAKGRKVFFFIGENTVRKLNQDPSYYRVKNHS